MAVGLVLTASGAHKHGALRTVRPHVIAYTLRFSARDFLALAKKSWFLKVSCSWSEGTRELSSLKEKGTDWTRKTRYSQ